MSINAIASPMVLALRIMVSSSFGLGLPFIGLVSMMVVKTVPPILPCNGLGFTVLALASSCQKGRMCEDDTTANPK